MKAQELASYNKFFNQFNRKVADLRIPFSGGIELTSRCNLDCLHCYMAPEERHGLLAADELETGKVLSIIDEITEAGCLNLLLTGGDPLVRKDFSEIYRHARRNGLLVTVFTNGTLVTDSIVSLFKEFPPYAVEISLYGATEEIYEAITRVKGSYQRCLKGIQLLLDNNIKLKLKTMLMTVNRHEFYAIEDMAKSYGVDFRFDAAISPRLNGDIFPTKLRVSAEEAVEKEFSDGQRRRRWQKFYNDFNGVQAEDSLYICGAGLSSFHIDSCGNLRPCLMTTTLSYSLLKGSFIKGWRDVMPKLRDRKSADGYKCNACEKKTLCGYCPGFSGLETGSEEISSDFLCSIGNSRFQHVGQSE